MSEEKKNLNQSGKKATGEKRVEKPMKKNDGGIADKTLDIPAFAKRERQEPERQLAPRQTRRQSTFWEEYGRYIIYGVAAVALVVILVIAGIALFGKKNPDNGSESAQPSQETSAEETPGETSTEAPKDTSLQEEAVPELSQLMKDYYDSLSACDLEALGKLVEDVSPYTQEKLDKQSQYIEDYLNIVCYTKPGLNDGEYVLYVYSEIKFANIDTAAPQLNHYYINEAVDGQYRLANGMLDNDKVAYMNEVDKHDDVLDLIDEVDDKLTLAMESDEKLNSLVQMLYNIPGIQDETTTAAPQEETFYVNGELFYRVNEVVYAKDEVNIRSGNSMDSEVVGTLYLGDYVTRTGYSEEWSQIIYKGETAYVYKGHLTTNKPE